MVGNRRPVILDLVARRRQVGADPVRRLAPALVRERPVEAGEGPVGLTGVVLGVLAGLRRVACQGRRSASTAPDGSVWATRKRPSRPSRRVVAPVAGRLPANRETGGEEGGRAGVDLALNFERGPVVALDEPLVRPVACPGRRSATLPAIPRRRPGRGPSSPRRGEPRCTRTRSSPPRRRRRRASCRRRPGCGRTSRRSACAEPRSSAVVTGGQRSGGATTSEGERRAISARVRPARQRRVAIIARGPGGRAGRSSVGSANHAVSGRRLSANATAGAAVEGGAVAVHELKPRARPEPARRGTGPASRARGRGRPDAGGGERSGRCGCTRSRVEGTAQTSEHRDAQEREDLHRRRGLDR